MQKSPTRWFYPFGCRRAYILLSGLLIVVGLMCLNRCWTLWSSEPVHIAHAAVQNNYTVYTVADSGAGSLRQAILDSNNNPGTNTIQFALEGSPLVISLLSPLPPITSPVTIDGTSQFGFTGSPIIALNGSQAGPGANGLQLSAGNSTIQGLVIQGFSGGAGIVIDTNGGDTLVGNDIGTDISGTTSIPNSVGIVIDAAATNNTIGGTVAGAGNLVAGNSGDGILLQGSGTTTNTIRFNTIRNNGGNGIVITASYNTIQLNTIRNNGGNGVVITASNNTVGGIVGGTAPNTITANGGSGVRVVSGSGNAILTNYIYGNGGLGIDTGPSGITLQNVPVLTWTSADASSTSIAGQLTASSNTTFRIELYASATCHPLGYGPGSGAAPTLLTAVNVTTDNSGKGTFQVTAPTAIPDGSNITATATDANNTTSEFSQCFIASTGNDSWPRAMPLTPTAGYENPSLKTAQVDQYIYRSNQERWYKFAVQPGATVTVTVTGPSGRPVSLHRDLVKLYNQLTTTQTTTSLIANTANQASLPYGSLPYGSLPYGSLPYGSLPAGSLPYGSLPYGSLPYGSLPYGSLPYGSLPYGSLPTGFQAQAYSGVLVNSLIALSANTNDPKESIVRNTWDLSENWYVRVGGSPNPTVPFHLQISIEGGICSAISDVPDTILPTDAPPLSSGEAPHHTIILTDLRRMSGSDSDKANMLALLQQLASRAEVNGIIVDLGDTSKYPRVAWANNQADQNLSCPPAKNIVASEIKRIVDSYRSVNETTDGQTTLSYVVLGGGDSVIPFFRYPDVAEVSPEKQYVPPVTESGALQADLKSNTVLGQDEYGAHFDIDRTDHTIPDPDLAVGRLVETASDVSGMITAYLKAGGVVTPNSALVTGYSFVADAAADVQAEFENGLNQTGQPLAMCKSAGTCPSADTLIEPGDLPPTSTLAWNGDQLRSLLLRMRHDLVFLSGHFSAGGLLAADYNYTTAMAASEVVSAPIDFSNAIIIALGCHSGFNISAADAIAGLTPQPDWPKAFNSRQATFIAETGYAYGDTDLTQYGERLFVDFSQLLRTGPGPVSLGGALVKAKQNYLDSTAHLGGVDEKTLIETTLFGLPMMSVNMPGQRLIPSSDASIVRQAVPVTNGPGAALGLTIGQPYGADNGIITITPTLTAHTVQVKSVTSGSMISATYLAGRDGLVTEPLAPILPLELNNVSVDGTTLRGVGFWGGTYSDQTGIVPLTSAPATELTHDHYSFKSSDFYPSQVWDENYFDALDGGFTQFTELLATPVQFKSTSGDSQEGTLRQFANISFRLFYSNNTSEATVASQPDIFEVSTGVITATGHVTFSALVEGDASAGIQAVWVTYTDPKAPGPHTWQSLELTQNADNPILWELADSGVPLSEDTQFMVQAVNGTGLVSVDTNLGAYYTITSGVKPPPPSMTTTLTLQSAPPMGDFGNEVSFRVSLTSNDGALANQLVTFELGEDSDQVTTDVSGIATFTVQLDQPPGEYNVRAAFDGTADYLNSSATSTFVINKSRTNLSLSPTVSNAQYSDNTGLIATLTEDDGAGVTEQSVFFVVSGPGGTYAESVITNYFGEAPLGAIPLPPGTYTVTAYFSGNIPVGNGQTQVLSDDFYLPSTATGKLILVVKDVTTTYAGDTHITYNAAAQLTVTVNFPTAGRPATGAKRLSDTNGVGDITRAQVRFDVLDAQQNVVTTTIRPVSSSGTASTTVSSLTAGMYTVKDTVVGNYFSSPTESTPFVVASAPLTITVDNKSKFQGEPNPIFTGSIIGLVNGDSITATYTTSATSASPVGVYDIVPAAVDSTPPKLGNYALTLITGTLTINPQPHNDVSALQSGWLPLPPVSDGSNVTEGAKLSNEPSLAANAPRDSALSTSLSGRAYHTAVWTGSEMLVWGGTDGASYFNDGARYNPTTNTWTALPIPPTTVLSGRAHHTAVWTGEEMIIFGGYDGSNTVNTGARYNPSTHTWAPIAPSPLAPRWLQSAVWDGTEMLVYGGVPDSRGLRYNPQSDSWTLMAQSPLAPRYGQSAVWDGQELIVFGGYVPSGTGLLGDGARYNPTSDRWTRLPSANAPAARAYHTAVWDGSGMIIYGGNGLAGAPVFLGDGARYTPATDQWAPLGLTAAPAGRSNHSAVWSGSEMIVWGGQGAGGVVFGDGARYNPVSQSWSALNPGSTTAPGPRYAHTAVWTGFQMILWGGQGPVGSTQSPSGHKHLIAGAPQQASGAPPRDLSSFYTTLAGQNALLADGARLVQNAVPLHAGWNLISIPFGSQGSLASLSSATAWRYDAPSGQWQRYRADLPGYANPLHSLTPSQALWVNVSQPSLLPQDSPIPASSDITLQPGWNLVGLPTTTQTTVSATFGSLYPTQVDHILYFADNTWVHATLSTPVYPGIGLWVHLAATQPITWTVTNP